MFQSDQRDRRRRGGSEVRLTHVGEALGKVAVFEFDEGPVHHDQAKHQVDPSAAKQERRDDAPQFKLVRDPVREERDPVRRDDFANDGQGDGEDAADRSPREWRDLGQLYEPWA